jgi:hypothetical protein
MSNRYKEILDASTYEKFVADTYRSLVSKEVGEVFLAKAYLGKRSGHKHQIDVSIELMVVGVSVVVLVECKFYKSAVQISDVLEFAERINDIGANKGIIVTTVGFQAGAYRIARGHGIALVTTEPVWQVVRYNSAENPSGMYVGPVYIGGGGTHLVGVTVDALNYGVSPRIDSSEAWQSIIMHLVDPDGTLHFNIHTERNAYWEIVGNEEVKRFRNIEQLAALADSIKAEYDKLPNDIGRHVLRGSVCSRCGCSAGAIVHFKWWACKGP